MIKIVGLGGSLRVPSFTYYALEAALKEAQSLGVETEMLDVRRLNLPFCNGSEDYPNHPDVKYLRQSIKNAHGIILATPEYHGSISGVLKNTLDLIQDENITGKVIALIAVLGGSSSTNALNTTRIICRQLHTWVIPEQLIIAHSDQAFDEKGILVDQEIHMRLQQLISKLIEAAYKFKN